MLDIFTNRIQESLSRKSISSPSQWAEKYRIMGKPYPGPWSFKHHPWLKEMHDSKADFNVGQKAAQMGYTETVLNWVFYNIDIQTENCLYILPTADDASDFSASRFDPALEVSDHLNNMFNNVKNVGLKRAGATSLFVRGSRSKSKLRSIPAGRIVFDELDVMVQDNIPLALERASGQVEKQIWMISTPTVHGVGINKYYEASTKEHYFFRCPHCSKFIELTFDSLILDKAYMICSECRGILNHEEKETWLQTAEWVASQPLSQSDGRGFYINQLYSPTIKPKEICHKYDLSLFNLADEQELFNSKMGMPHVTDNAKVTETNIQNCIKPHKNCSERKSKGLVTMGIDVGKWLHYIIVHWLPKEGGADLHTSLKPRVVAINKVADFEMIDPLIVAYGVHWAVIDANPERRKSLDLCNRLPAHACFYGKDIKIRDIVVSNELPTITVDRNSWLDLSIGRLINEDIELPLDTPYEYKAHMQNIVKVYEKDADGNAVGRWKNDSRPDHYAHAFNYAEIAVGIASSGGNCENILN